MQGTEPAHLYNTLLNNMAQAALQLRLHALAVLLAAASLQLEVTRGAFMYKPALRCTRALLALGLGHAASWVSANVRTLAHACKACCSCGGQTSVSSMQA